MERKGNNDGMPGWQLTGYSGSELDYNLENDKSEDEEYRFYMFTRENENNQKERIKENKKGRDT